MNYEEAKRSFASHANLPGTDLPIEGSFVGGLWLVAQKNAEPRFMQHADEIINCLQTVNTYFNGPDPNSRSGRPDHSRISEVAYFVSGIISGGLTLHLKLNRMRQMDSDCLVHPALPWVEIKSAAVEQDSFFEILNVSITTEKPDGPQLAAPTFLSISNLFSLEEPELKTLEMRDLLSLH
jgi:hypothetical protein